MYLANTLRNNFSIRTFLFVYKVGFVILRTFKALNANEVICKSNPKLIQLVVADSTMIYRLREVLMIIMIKLNDNLCQI